MYPKIHKNGRSFKGIARYLLHDVGRATTSDRVAWVETRNLATNNPDIAWRVMAATAMDADRLKAEAGLRKTGNKRGGPVMHVTMSLKDGEVENLTREQMTLWADGILAELGRKATKSAPAQYANEHQAMIVCHTDTKHPHLHIVINRVHPEHGRSLSPSFSYRKLEDWAKKFEIENGKILCPKRIENEQARQRGERPKKTKDQPRGLHELEKQYADRSDADRIRKEQRTKDQELGRRWQQSKDRRRASWEKLKTDYFRGRNSLKDQTRLRKDRAEAAVRRDFEPSWRKLYAKQRRDLVEFAKREQKLLGRVQNALAAIDWRLMLKSNDRAAAIREVFERIGSHGKRLEAMKKAQQTEANRLKAKERSAVRAASTKVRDQSRRDLARHRIQFLNRREELAAERDLDRAEMRLAWRKRDEERQQAWTRRIATRDFNAAARNPDPRERQEQTRSAERVAERNPDPRRRDQGDSGYERSS